MLDEETRALLEGGCALIIGSVDDDGAPHAARGWGLDVVSDPPCRIRLLLDAHDERSLANLAAGRPVAVTAAEVVTLRSVQVKGTSAGTGVAGPDAPSRRDRYVEAFYRDIVDTDGTPRAVLDRLTPDDLLVLEVDLSAVFDQTPGPVAGRCITAPS